MNVSAAVTGTAPRLTPARLLDLVRDDRITAIATATGVALVASILYLRTLAPSIAWAHQGADSGDLVAAAVTLGIPHPSGYPLFTLLAHLAAGLTPADPARGVNLFDAACGAIAAGLTAWLAGLLAPSGYRSLAALAAGLLLAVSPVFWSQAIITEVYALAALLLAALLVTLISWRCRWPDPRAETWLVAAGFLIGLTAAHHLTLLLIVPFVAGFVVITARRAAFRPRVWLSAGLALVPGLLLYLYLPLRAAANPPINWGRPADWEGFWWVVSGGGYGRNVLKWDLLGRGALNDALVLLADQFPWPLWVVAVGGFVYLARRHWPAALLLGGSAGAITVYRLTYQTFSIDAYYIPLYLIVAVAIGLGLAALLQFAVRRGARPALVTPPAVAAILVLTVIMAAVRYETMDLSRATDPRDFGIQMLQAVPPSSVVITNRDDRTFSLWYAQAALGMRPDVALVSPPLLQWPWYQTQLAVTYPDLVVGEISGPTGSRYFDLIRRNLGTHRIFLGEEIPVVPWYFEVRPFQGELVEVIRDRAEPR